MKKEYYDLLKQWCDRLIELQIKDTGVKELDGGIMCPACSRIHGRCHDAVYPFMYMAHASGDEKYLNAAKALFDWGDNVFCDDGSFYNDRQSTWNAITVFSSVALCDTLDKHGSILDQAAKKKWEDRLALMGEWLYENLTMEFGAVINYPAACSAAMALLGTYFDNEAYKKRARELAHICMDYLTENGLLRGEGKPIDAVTPRGCYPIDIGYNAEESMPSLVIYAFVMEDHEVLTKVKDAFYKLLSFMLPDGAWDNSFGTRNSKWTYWGSRTSDGCQGAFALLGKDDPVFAEAALRNFRLYKECTHDGLLHGGPHYHEHGEPPCVHHTFCHAKVLAMALDAGAEGTERVSIPSDNPPPLVYYKEADTYKIAMGDFRGTITGYDFPYVVGGQASGGTLTMLWHKDAGPLIASSMTDYSIVEAVNMQLSLKKAQHRSLTPRVAYEWEGKQYAQCYDYNSFISAKEEDKCVTVSVDACLVDIEQKVSAFATFCHIEYHFDNNSVQIKGKVSGDKKSIACFVLPVISKHRESCALEGNTAVIQKGEADVIITASGFDGEPKPIFCLSGGFEAREFTVSPNENGEFSVTITVQ
ncbi:MAG: hypothetical protein ACOX22_02420 [Caldicoprobacterales bacterium]